MKLLHTLIPALLIAAALPVSAKVVAAGTNPTNFSYAATGTYVPINGGATTLNVTVPKAGRYVLTFSAECSVSEPAGNTNAWVEVDIEVNGVAVSPTAGTSDALCSADGVAGFGGWVRPSVTTVVTLAAGANTVRVKGGFQNGAVGGWLSDTSIVIHQ